MTGHERSELAELNARLFGLDGSGEGGAIGSINDRLAQIDARLNRWDGAISLIRATAAILGIGGIALIAIALAS